LINASVSIAEKVDPATIIALIDNSRLSNGKAGIVFTGDTMYLKPLIGNGDKILLKDISGAFYDIETIMNDRGKTTENRFLKIDYKNKESIKIVSEKYGKDFPFKLIAGLLDDFNENVSQISARSQVIQLNNMSPHIITIYFRIIIAYLKDNDGVIDSQEYKELITLMTKSKSEKK